MKTAHPEHKICHWDDITYENSFLYAVRKFCNYKKHHGLKIHNAKSNNLPCVQPIVSNQQFYKSFFLIAVHGENAFCATKDLLLRYHVHPWSGKLAVNGKYDTLSPV